MGRGTSPLRSAVVRGSPKKPAQENMDGNCMSSGDLTPTRRPLSSISEACRNSDESGADALTPKGKVDGTTPKGKKRGGQCLFPHAENGEGIPERQGNGKSKKPHGRHQSPMKSQPASRLQDASAAEPGADVSSVGMAPTAAGAVSKGLPEQQGMAKQGSESANSHTPRAHRNERAVKHGADSEPVSSVRPNCNQSVSATPAKSVTRTLKYGAAQGAATAASSTSRALVPLPGGGRHVSQGTSEQQFNLEEDPTFWHDHNVQVLIRTRPISSTEMVSQGFSKCLKQESPHTLTWLGPPETRFTFDHVAGEIISQEKLFRVAGLPMVENCMAGYNSCMFAYGQTGSGKTHTMLGDIEHLGDRPSDNRGMTPRVFEYLFSRIQLEEERRQDENLKFLTKCSFLEIYNEQITDLLEPTSTNLQMREDVRKGVYVDNLTEVEVNSVQDVIQLLSQGSANRKVASTNMNRESSRSHSVFTCIIESRWERDSMTNIRFGRLNLVDLAGSERQKSSGAEGERLKEAANINKSLSTLGLVIMILVDVANGKQRHVPYRDSKLTFLLQDSLGGNSKTTIIATVSPSSCNALETLSTLKFAQRAKLIRNTAVVNEDASGDVKALRAQIQQMKEELDRLRRQSISRIPLSQDDFNPVRGSFDSWGDAHKFFGSPQVSSRKLRQMEAVVAGALRREQASEVATKRLAAEIAQLNRLVHQREAETQSSKMVLRFREDKIRRLEALSKGLLSVDSCLADEKQMLTQELELMRETVDRNPELTRFAMENIRLLDQIRSLEEFREGGERDVMLEEMSNLRDQLLEALDGKIAADQGLVPLTTPQKKALAPELAAAARENELLRLEADNYRWEVEELRSNLRSSLESYSKMGRQVDELQELVEKLTLELAAKGDSTTETSSMTDLELENSKHLELISELKLQLEQSAEKSKVQASVREQLDLQLKDSLVEAQNLRSELEATKEAFESARALTKKLQSKEAALVGAQYAAAVKQIRLETEEMAVQQSQSLTNIQEMAVLFRMKETELRTQLDDAQQMIEKLSMKEEERVKSCQLISAPNSVRAEDGSLERLQKAQEIEMRHAEEVMQLQLELESLEAVLDEERSQKKELEEKLGHFEVAGTSTSHDEEGSLGREVEAKVLTLTQQLQEAEEMISKLKAAGEVRETTYFDAVSRLQLYSPDPKSARLSEQLDHDKVVMEALENQHLYSIREFQALQGEHAKALGKLKRREERERILRRKIESLERELVKEQEVRELEREYADLEEGGAADEAERAVLEQKLENAKRELEVTRRENLKLKEEDTEKDLTRCEAESQTVLAITSMQAELGDLRAEAEASDRELAAAKGTVSELTSELGSMRMMLSDAKDENLQLIERYESMLGVKDSEIGALRKDRERATVELVDYLAEGDQALNKAWLEMEQISCGHTPFSARSSRDSMHHSRTNEKRKAVEHLKHLQHAQELAKDAEGKVRVLSEAAFAMSSDQAPDTPQEVHRLRTQAAEAVEVLQGELESWRQKFVEFGRNATVMSAVMVWLSKSVEAKEIAGSTARGELREAELAISAKERLLSELRDAQEADRSLLRVSEERVRQLSEHLEKTKGTVSEKAAAVAGLGSEVARLESLLEALESERKHLVESKEKVESEASETRSAVNDLREELASGRSLLKEAEHKADEAAAAHASLAIVKEVWEAEKAGLESDVRRLEKEKSSLEAEVEASRVELEEAQARSDKLSNVVLEKEVQVAALAEERSSLSCRSVAREEEQQAAHEAALELLRSELRQNETLLKQAEIEHLESVRASDSRENEREREIAEMKEQRETLSSMIAKKEEELDASRREFEVLQTELQRKQVLLEEAATSLLQAGQASEQLMREKDERIASLKEESERMSCTSVQKEDGEVAEMRRKLESLQGEIRAKERALEEVEKQLSESVQASRALGQETDEAIRELKAEVNRLSSMYAENRGELSRLREELRAIQTELESREVLLQESQTRVLEADAALEKIAREKDAIQSELESREVLLLESETRVLEAEAALANIAREKGAIQSELESRESLLEEFRARVGEADAALEAVVGENAVLESRLESASIESSVSASRLCEAEEAQSVLQEKVAAMEARIVEYEDREQSLLMEVEELSTARNMSEEDVNHLQSEVVELRRERDSLNLEVSTMDAQSAISEKLQFIQSMCMDTDNRIASMQSEIEDLTSAKEALETEVRSIEARAVQLSQALAEREESLAAARNDLERVQMDLMDVTADDSAAREELKSAKSQLQAAEENMKSMSTRIDELKNSRADKEEENALLRERLERASVNRMEAQGKLDALSVVMHGFSRSEESWRSERSRIVSEIEAMRSELTEKAAEVAALQVERKSLEIRLHGVSGEKDAALASIGSLENRSDKFEAGGKCAGKDASSVSDEVELAKARAALAGAEEKVKLLADANATMTVEWEGERSRLNADKELLQLEICRLEKPLDRVADEKRSTSEDGERGKDNIMDELKQLVKRTSADCEKLRCKLRERDTTILSVKLQLEEAMVHYKETEIEMEKTIREKEDAISRIVELEGEVADAHEEIMRRREQVETFELELENVVVRVTDSEARWKSHREQLENERDDARAEAIEIECELREQLKRERDAARAEADEHAALRKRIEETQYAFGKVKDCVRESRREVEECASLSLESISAFALAQEEVDLTKNHCEKEMETLAGDMKSLRADISGSFFEFPVVEIQEDVKSVIEAHRTELAIFAGKVEALESVVAESRSKISTLEAALENAQEIRHESLEEGQCVDSANSEQGADLASACADLENTRAELEMSEAAVSQLLATVSERDDTLSVLKSVLNETRDRLAEIEAEREANRQQAEAAKLALVDVDQLRSQILGLQRQLAQKEELIKGFEYDINLLEETGTAEADSAASSIGQLQKELEGRNEELERLKKRTATLESELREKLEDGVAGDAASATEAAVENANLRAKVAGLDARLASLDALAKEEELAVLSLKSELESARSRLEESEADAAKARQSAEVFKTYAESRAEEMMANERLLKARVSSLEDQVTGLERKAEEQSQLREQVEKELRISRQLGSTFSALESREAQPAKQSLERKLRVVEAELSTAHQRREDLQSQCDEKDGQIKALSGRINQLTLAAGRQTPGSQQKERGLEALTENDSGGKSLARTSSMGPCVDFRTADAGARRRIEELEALAAGRLKEVYGLNAKVAELESDLHDVVRGLVRCNLDVQSMKLNHPQVQEIVANVRRQSIENQRPDTVQDAEVERLRKKLNEFIEERDSWLEEITRQQAEIVAARASAEKMRFRDDTLTAENEKLKAQSAGLQKRLGELEQEIKKLSGQQNLQQRIHHHAKIKDENNSLRLQVEDLNTKLRRAEMVFGRVKPELERYRLAAGKTPFPDVDEEQRLRSKLQEAEESKIQLAQQFISLSNAIQQAAGKANSVRQVDESAAMDAVHELESRLRTAEDEVSEFRLKTRISGEKRRLSELRTFHTPVKSNPAAVSQPFLSSPAIYR